MHYTLKSESANLIFIFLLNVVYKRWTFYLCCISCKVSPREFHERSRHRVKVTPELLLLLMMGIFASTRSTWKRPERAQVVLSSFLIHLKLCVTFTHKHWLTSVHTQTVQINMKSSQYNSDHIPCTSKKCLIWNQISFSLLFCLTNVDTWAWKYKCLRVFWHCNMIQHKKCFLLFFIRNHQCWRATSSKIEVNLEKC